MKITATQRPVPTLISPSDTTEWDWGMVQRHLSKPSALTRVRLWFRPWETVLAPKGTPCAVTTMRGFPIFQFKRLDGKAYHLQPEPSMGFPGS